jgi:hypothetical protein
MSAETSHQNIEEEDVRSRFPLGALWRAALLSCTIALAACALPTLAGAAAPPPTSDVDCGGTLTPDPGGKAADDPNLLDYSFNCDGGITAYTVIVQQQGDASIGGTIDDYNPSPSVFETDGVTPAGSEAVTCEGTTPSNGINCNMGAVGAQLSDGYFADGSVDPVGPYCRHLPVDDNGKTITRPGTLAIPKAVVSVVVTDYTGAQDGPFALHYTKTCPAVPAVVPRPKTTAKKKTASKKAATHKQSSRKSTTKASQTSRRSRA